MGNKQRELNPRANGCRIKRKPTKATNEEEVSEADRQLHQKIAAQVKAKLEAKGKSTEGVETFEEFYGILKTEATVLQREFQPQLRNGIKIAIDLVNKVQQDKKDGDVDIRVRIAPNTEEKLLSFDFGEQQEQKGKGIASIEELVQLFKEKHNIAIRENLQMELRGGSVKADVRDRYRTEFDKEKNSAKKKKVVIITWEIDTDKDPGMWMKHRASKSSADEKIKIFGTAKGSKSDKNLGLGLPTQLLTLPTDATPTMFHGLIKGLNNDRSVGAIIVQSPPPPELASIER
ncbi:MAG: hypothetical protein AB8E82_14940 [Aureispira sp.]